MVGSNVKGFAMLYDLTRLSPALRSEIENSPQWRRFFSAFPSKMVAFSGDAKTVKGEKQAYLTGILYLVSSDISGVNLCPMAKIAACDLPCLLSAGRGAMNFVFMSRLRKTLFFLQYQEKAIALIKRDITRLEKTAMRKGFTLVIRLNGTSDIRFERHGIIQSFPHIQFYDYTKIVNRHSLPENYDITFSYSGVEAFANYNTIAAIKNMRIAAVFRSRALVESLINNGATFNGMPIIDGDETDLRFLEPQGVIVALYAKGKAKRDGTGFVIDENNPNIEWKNKNAIAA